MVQSQVSSMTVAKFKGCSIVILVEEETLSSFDNFNDFKFMANSQQMYVL